MEVFFYIVIFLIDIKNNYTCRFAGGSLCRRQLSNWPAFVAGNSAKPAKVKHGCRHSILNNLCLLIAGHKIKG